MRPFHRHSCELAALVPCVTAQDRTRLCRPACGAPGSSRAVFRRCPHVQEKDGADPRVGVRPTFPSVGYAVDLNYPTARASGEVPAALIQCESTHTVSQLLERRIGWRA